MLVSLGRFGVSRFRGIYFCLEELEQASGLLP